MHLLTQNLGVVHHPYPRLQGIQRKQRHSDLLNSAHFLQQLCTALENILEMCHQVLSVILISENKREVFPDELSGSLYLQRPAQYKMLY